MRVQGSWLRIQSRSKSMLVAGKVPDISWSTTEVPLSRAHDSFWHLSLHDCPWPNETKSDFAKYQFLLRCDQGLVLYPYWFPRFKPRLHSDHEKHAGQEHGLCKLTPGLENWTGAHDYAIPNILDMLVISAAQGSELSPRMRRITRHRLLFFFWYTGDM